MNFSKLTTIAAALILFTVGSSEAAKKPKPDFQIKFATLAPDGSTWMKTMHKIDEEVRARTENRVGFKFYPGGVQGDEKDVLRKIRNKQLHAGGFTGFGLGAIAPEVRVQELPFLFETHEELDYLREQMGDVFVEDFAKKGFVHLGWADVGFVYIVSKQKITSPDDLRAAKMWVWAGDPLAELFFSAFDVSPVPLASPDVLTSLQTGIINGIYGSPLAIVALQWYTKVKYMSDVPVTHGMGAVLISKRAVGKNISDADMVIIQEVAAPHLRALTLKTRTQNTEAIEEMKKEGIEILASTPEVRKEFFEKGRAAWGDGVGTIYSQELLDRVKAVIESYQP